MGKDHRRNEVINRLAAMEAILPVVQFGAAAKTYQVSNNAREITKLKLISTGGAAHVSCYDNASGQANPTDLKWVLDSSLQSNDTDDFPGGLRFNKGLYLVCDDGFAFNPQVCVGYNP